MTLTPNSLALVPAIMMRKQAVGQPKTRLVLCQLPDYLVANGLIIGRRHLSKYLGRTPPYILSLYNAQRPSYLVESSEKWPRSIVVETPRSTRPNLAENAVFPPNSLSAYSFDGGDTNLYAYVMNDPIRDQDKVGANNATEYQFARQLVLLHVPFPDTIDRICPSDRHSVFVSAPVKACVPPSVSNASAAF